MVIALHVQVSVGFSSYADWCECGECGAYRHTTYWCAAAMDYQCRLHLEGACEHMCAMRLAAAWQC